jgi:hypothetical protein
MIAHPAPLVSRYAPLRPRREYFQRLFHSFSIGAALVIVSLTIGMVGYHGLESMSWLDSFLNASMIMSGMGPVATLKTDAGKLFAGCYALYCGLALITAAAIILTPVAHRFLHRFHLEDERRSR